MKVYFVGVGCKRREKGAAFSLRHGGFRGFGDSGNHRLDMIKYKNPHRRYLQAAELEFGVER